MTAPKDPGLQAAARARRNERARLQYRANLEERRAANRAYYAKVKGRICAYNREYYARDDVKTKQRARERARRYGADPKTITELLNSRNTCAICDVAFNSGKGTARHVDHSHASGKLRDLLCHRCNIKLGFIEGQGEWLEKAIAYLEKHGGSL